MKKLAICIPNYNRFDMFKRLLEQLILQIKKSKNKEDIEICVSDDASEFDITDYIRQMSGINTDILIKFNRFSRNKGLMSNLKYSVDMAESEYCWVIGNDDMLSEDNAIDIVIDTLYDKKADILIFPILQNTEKQNIMVYPSKNNLESRMFDFKIKEDYNLWFDNSDSFSNQDHISSLFIFISHIIFKKSNWDKYKAECDWNDNSLFYQSFIHHKSLLNNSLLYYFDVPLIIQNANFYVYDVMKNRSCYCYELIKDMYEYIDYFFDGDLEEKLLDYYCFFVYYGIVIESSETSDFQKNYVKNIDAPMIKLLNKLYLPIENYSKLYNKNLLLFGSGDMGKASKKRLEENNLSVSYYIDNNSDKHGKIIDGIKVISPEKSLEIADSIYIIAAYDKGAFCSIYNQLIEMGVSKDNIVAIL